MSAMLDDNQVIQGVWIGDRLSLMEQLSIKSFLAHGHVYHLYVYQDVKGIPSGTVVKNAADIVSERQIFKYRSGFGAGSFAGFADLFRYKMLCEKGGYWSDLDMVCLKPFDFHTSYVFSSEYGYEDKTVINCGVIKVPRASELMKVCYQEALEKVKRNIQFGEIGPALLKHHVIRLALEKYVLPPACFCPLKGCFYPELVSQSFRFSLLPDSYAIHLWNEMWRIENSKKRNFWHQCFGIKRMDKNRRYDPRTLYGLLQKKYL